MRYGLVSLIAGAALLVVCEVAPLHALRIVAIALMLGGAIAVGIAAGLGARTLPARVGGLFTRGAVCVIAVLLVLPMLTVLIAALLGVAVRVSQAGSVSHMPLIVTGCVLAALFLAASLTALITGMAAIRGRLGARVRAANAQAQT